MADQLAGNDRMLGVCRTNLLAYAIAQMQGYKVGAHHRLVARALERVVKGECKRLMIFMPPRHGKSQLVADFFPAWYLGHWPNEQVIYATYGQELADDFGRRVRNQLKDPLFQKVFPDVHLAEDSQAVAKFNTTEDGVYVAVGIGGSLTGRGADLLIIDDPVKNREEAESDLQRKKTKDWYTSTAFTRLMPSAAIIVIQTRWHEDDLSGWLLEEAKAGGDQWEIIDFPAILNEGEEDADGNSLEAALWPEQFTLEDLQAKRRVMGGSGARDWQSLYQQQPRPPSGGEFKKHWIQYYAAVGQARGMTKYLLVDPANSKRKDKSNDYTSIWVVGLNWDNNLYILDMVRDRLDLSARTSEVFRLHRKWRPNEVRYEQYGMMADAEHIKLEQEKQQYRFKIVPVGGSVAKEDRIRRMIPYFFQERFYFPAQFWYTDAHGEVIDLVDAFLNQEYLPFPIGRHDDMLDGLARLFEPDKSLALKWPSVPEPQVAGPGYGVVDEVAGF